jgi:hypothetical protein
VRSLSDLKSLLPKKQTRRNGGFTKSCGMPRDLSREQIGANDASRSIGVVQEKEGLVRLWILKWTNH